MHHLSSAPQLAIISLSFSCIIKIMWSFTSSFLLVSFATRISLQTIILCSFFLGLTLVTVKAFLETVTISSEYRDGHKSKGFSVFWWWWFCRELLCFETPLENWEKILQNFGFSKHLKNTALAMILSEIFMFCQCHYVRKMILHEANLQ